MKRMTDHLHKVMLLLLIVVVVGFSLANLFSRHDITGVASGMSASCASLCLTHTQPVATANATDDIRKDDNEPSPPQYIWPQVSISLLSLYVSIVIFSFWLLEKQKRILLTTQLRI